MHEIDLDSVFVGGYPMTRSEGIGFTNPKANLLGNTYYIITKTDEGKPKKYEELVRSIDAIPLIMTPEEYDLVTAAVSHVPHVISASLVNLVKDSNGGEMRMVAARRFNDIAKTSSSSPIMWQQICLTNPKNISSL